MNRTFRLRRCLGVRIGGNWSMLIITWIHAAARVDRVVCSGEGRVEPEPVAATLGRQPP
jgi:hypothetical protein